MKFTAPLLCLTFLCSGIPAAQAAISTTSVTASGMAGENGIVYAWTLPDLKGSGAGVLLSIGANRVLKPWTYTVGIGHVWFLAKPGDIIDAAFVSTATVFANSYTGDLSGSAQVIGFGTGAMLGFWLDANEGVGNAGYEVPGQGDVFGWARLVYDPSTGLQVAESATENTGAGIIAGTTTAVPEPAAGTMLLAAGSCLLLCRRGRGRGRGRRI